LRIGIEYYNKVHPPRLSALQRFRFLGSEIYTSFVYCVVYVNLCPIDCKGYFGGAYVHFFLEGMIGAGGKVDMGGGFSPDTLVASTKLSKSII
jgi:hypothetical protein